MKNWLLRGTLLTVIIGCFGITAIDLKPYDKDVWSSESRPLLDKYRLDYFNSLLREIRNYSISRPHLVNACVEPEALKALLKKIKKKCNLQKKVIFYRVEGYTHTPVRDNRACKEKPLRKEGCYTCMKGLYKILRAIQQEEELYKKQRDAQLQQEIDSTFDSEAASEEGSSSSSENEAL